MKKRIASRLLNPFKAARTIVSAPQMSSMAGIHTEGRTLVMRRLQQYVSEETEASPCNSQRTLRVFGQERIHKYRR